MHHSVSDMLADETEYVARYLSRFMQQVAARDRSVVRKTQRPEWLDAAYLFEYKAALDDVKVRSRLPKLPLTEDNFEDEYEYHLTSIGIAAINRAYTSVKSVRNPYLEKEPHLLYTLISHPDLKTDFADMVAQALQSTNEVRAYTNVSDKSLTNILDNQSVAYQFFMLVSALEEDAARGKRVVWRVRRPDEIRAALDAEAEPRPRPRDDEDYDF